MKKLYYLLSFMLIICFLACNKNIDEEDLVCENPIVFFNQLDLKYSSYDGVQSLYISRPDCDVCQIGVEGAEACECRKGCYSGVNAILDECRDDPYWDQCAEDYAYDVYYENVTYSLEEACCPEAQEHVEDCQNACGNVPSPIRSPIGFTYGVEIWTSTTTILDNPPSTPSNAVIVGEEIEGNPTGVTVDISEYLTSDVISFCVETTYVILYDDGKCCMYKDRLCREI